MATSYQQAEASSPFAEPAPALTAVGAVGRGAPVGSQAWYAGEIAERAAGAAATTQQNPGNANQGPVGSVGPTPVPTQQNPYNPLTQPGSYSNFQLSHPEAAAMPASQAQAGYAAASQRQQESGVYNPPPPQTGYPGGVTPTQGLTIYTAYGDRAQTEVKNINALVYGQVGGGWVATQIPYGHSISNIVAGGGSGSLQSGMFSLKPLTPIIYTQESGANKVLADTAVPAAAALVLASPQSYSRLGAEAYGGYVAPLDNRVLTPASLVSVYPEGSGNLANLVNPTGVNQPKQNWEVMPWNVPVQETPSIIPVDAQGRISPSISVGYGSTVEALPTPFMSKVTGVTVTPASPIIDVFGIKVNAGAIGEFFNPPITTVTTQGSPVQVNMMNMGGAVFTNKFIVNGKPSDSMTYPVGAPVVVGDVSTQMYETVKVSNVGTVIPITSISTAGLSAFGQLNKDISDKYIKPFTPTPEQATKSGYALFNVGNIVEGKGRVITPADVADFEKKAPIMSAGVKFFSEGVYGGARNEPVTAGVSYGAGALFGGLWRGAEGISTVAMPTLVKNVPAIAKILQTGAQALPYVFGAAIVGETAYRSTEGFSNFEPSSVATISGKITSTEIMPGFAGFGFGYNAPENAGFIYRSAIRAPGEISDVIWSTQQRIGGISRMEPGARPSDFAVTGRSIPAVERSLPTAMKYGIGAGEPIKTVGDYFDMQPGNRGISTEPQPPSAMKYGFKAGEPVRTVGEYFDIRSTGEQSLTTRSSIDSIDLIYARRGTPLDVLPKSNTNIKTYSNRPFTAVQDISIEEMGANPWKHTTNVYDPWKVKPVTKPMPTEQAIKEVKISPERRVLIEESRWYAVRGLTKPLEYEIPSSKNVGSDIEQGQYGSVVVLKAPIQMEIPGSKLETTPISKISQKQAMAQKTALPRLGIRASVGTQQELARSRLRSQISNPISTTAQKQSVSQSSRQVQRQVAVPSLIAMGVQGQISKSLVEQSTNQEAQQRQRQESMVSQISGVSQMLRTDQLQRQTQTIDLQTKMDQITIPRIPTGFPGGGGGGGYSRKRGGRFRETFSLAKGLGITIPSPFSPKTTKKRNPKEEAT